jgi:hypothetical protein
MSILITWSWFSFIAGFLSSLFVGFWLVLGLAFKQWSSKRKKTAETDRLYADLLKGKQ